MTLNEQLNQDLSTAMKEGLAARTAVLRLLKNALQQERIKLGHDLSDDESLKVLQREAKQRKDSIAQYRQGDRSDLAEAEQQELGIIQAYLPEQMSEQELSELVDKVIAETGANSPAQMGIVIGAVIKQADGQAEGSAVSQLVRQKLS